MPARQTPNTVGENVTIRPLQEADLPSADRIFRRAFATFLGAPDPITFFGDVDYVRTRWLADRSAALGAELEGELVGSNFATSWGSVGFFGPLTVRPDLWDRGIGKSLLEQTMDLFGRWGTKHIGLFTFAQSAKHIGLYQRFGFWPRFLTAVMSKPIEDRRPELQWSVYSDVPGSGRMAFRRSCEMLTDSVHPGLDLQREIRAVDEQKLGDTVLLSRSGVLVGLAVCHCGASSEAGSGACYVKFGAVRPGATAPEDFEELLTACEAYAASRKLLRIVAGVNMERHDAYRRMIERGFHTEMQGVTMHRPNEPGYNLPDVYLIDDWR